MRVAERIVKMQMTKGSVRQITKGNANDTAMEEIAVSGDALAQLAKELQDSMAQFKF